MPDPERETYEKRLREVFDHAELEFRKIKKDFDRDVQERWTGAADYFREWKDFLSEIRADFGGHFDHGSAIHAVRERPPSLPFPDPQFSRGRPRGREIAAPF